jgi:hypothetical protein
VAFAKTLRFGLAAALMLFAVQSAIGLFAALALNPYDSVFDLDRNNGIPDLLSTGGDPGDGVWGSKARRRRET